MRRTIRLRLRFLSGVLLFFALLLIARLYFLQVVHGEEYVLKAERQYASGAGELYDRGSIYFTRKDGTLISAATLLTGFTLALNPSLLEDAEAAYAALSKIISLPRDDFFARAAKTDDPYEELLRHVSEEDGKAMAALAIPGVVVARERWRVYPADARGAQSVGFTAFGADDAYRGRYGLERYYDDLLDRTGGVFGNFFAELFTSVESVVVDARRARAGDLLTGVEPVVAERLANVLAEVHAAYASAETGGIIMDAKTGTIVALDVLPSFDPNHLSEGNPEYFGNPLVEHVYEFGSIMKPLTMAAGLDAGVITSASRYTDEGCVHLNTSTFCNFDGKARGTVPVQEILSQSLNVGAAHIAGLLGHERMRSYFTALGFGKETGIDLPNETHGITDNLESPRDIEYATAAFGQGIAVTPVEMIRALGALANGGEIVTPRIGTAVRLESGIVKHFALAPAERIFKEAVVEETTRMLVTVVDTALAHGTLSIPEMSVAAKTGTAQIPGPSGGYYKDRYFHSFFGYFPAYDPRYIILLYTREPKGVQYASETLSNPFMDLAHFLISYYAIPPDRAPL